MSDQLQQLVLHERHEGLEAKFGTEGDFQVPLSYGDVLGECLEIGQRAGLADLSHAGRVRLRGDDSLALLERACTHDVARQEDDTAVATLLCNERGGIVADATLVRLEDEWLLLTGPATRGKALEHLRALGEGLDVRIDDHAAKTVELLLAGPASAGILDAILPFKMSDVSPGGVKAGTMLIAKYIAVRMDIGSVWCSHVILPNLLAGQAWDYMTTRAKGQPVRPVGMAALDVLRIEQGLPRYGHELNETIDPVTAGLQAAVSGRGDYLGAAAIAEIARRGPARRRVGLAMASGQVTPQQVAARLAADDETTAPDAAIRLPGIPRLGDDVLDAAGAEVGTVTSGTWSPTREGPVAMAYVAASAVGAGRFQVKTAAGLVEATVIARP